MLLALYNGCIILLIGLLVFMELYLVFKRRGQVILCTECQQCVSACPLLAKGCNPLEIMLAAKSGQETQAMRNATALCVRCGRCQSACPRGLAPYLEIHEWEQATEAENEETRRRPVKRSASQPHSKLIIMSKPPALPGDSRSLTVPGIDKSFCVPKSSSLRNGASHGRVSKHKSHVRQGECHA